MTGASCPNIGDQARTGRTANDLVFLDFEASGLGLGTWPIEIGLCRINADLSFRTQSRLICPHASWDPTKWSRDSQMIHNIDRVDLDTAPAAETVARWALEELRDAVVVSDAPDFDLPWLDTLLATIDKERAVQLHDFDEMMFAVFGRAGASRAFAYLEDTYVPHRAGPDAQRLACAWLAAARRSPP